jgi:peptidoglycan/LPS O-acetylase OafA/YrhL
MSAAQVLLTRPDPTPTPTPSPTPDPAPRGQAFVIPSLDGLRALSIFVVFVSHCGLNHSVPALFGVTLFFFLSGYLITTLLRIEAEKTGRVSLRQFYLRRSLRILPPLYITLLATLLLALGGWLKATISWASVSSQALYVFNYYGFDGCLPGTGVLWSLSVEEHFYLLFPLVYIALRRWVPRPRHQFLLMGAACAGVLAWRLVQAHWLGWVGPGIRDGYWDRTGYTTDSRVDSILFGCMLGVWANPALDPPRLSRRACLGLALPGSVVLLLLTFAWRENVFRETWRYTLQGLALFPIFVAVVRYPEWGPFRFLGSAILKYVALLSYSIYLVHLTVFMALEQWVPSWGGLERSLTAFALSVAIASLLYHGVERPLARLRRRFS